MREPAQGSAPCDHLVQVYRDPYELAAAVALFFASGFAAGDSAVAVATPAHWALVVERLARRGWDAEELESSGRLTVADAETTLAAICPDGTPSPARFEAVVGAILDRAAGEAGVHVRAFGEMVDLLVRRGESGAADALEGIWNHALERRRFSLLCGYRIDLFDRHAQLHLLPQVYRAHTEVVTATEEIESLDRALDAALVDILGHADAQKVYRHVERQRHDDRVPRAHLALQWLSAHMPVTAERILAQARENYLGDPATAPNATGA